MAISPSVGDENQRWHMRELIFDVLKLLFSQQTVCALQVPAELRPRTLRGVQVTPTGMSRPCMLRGRRPRSFVLETWFAGWTVSQH